ncbi:hypothetical protein C2845_PM11G19330 [Panicum miliaceum]|uniref:DUF2921 domain-containing protein n=1 Tax=Panicum miliaceum TaxID=4540 RepID=A0A3L6RSY8_PANMI|nr:hypothetical protein C2845_PM11G19330 [Panicum miliaceum]
MEATSKIFTGLLLLNLALFLPCLSATVSSNLSSRPSLPKGPIHHDYTHVERHCQSVLSSAAELGSDPDSAGALKYKLSFVNGDWTQDAGQAPLLPSHGSYADAAAAGPDESPQGVPLASFMLLHMDTVPRRGARTALDASGVLSLTITRRNCCCSYMDPSAAQYFELRPGIARLLVLFQGVYTETKSSASGGGERVLCMVGDRVFPVPCTNGADPWDDDWISFKPPVTADGNILLVLRYPMATTLATRAVRGEMTSTSARSDGAYFDTVRLVSQLAGGYSSGYQFQPEVPGCNDGEPPLSDDGDAMEMDQQLSSGASLCDIINRSTPDSQAIMEVVPNWDCKGTDAFCSRAGPFATASRPAASATEDTAFTRSAIAVQGLTCRMTATSAGGAAAARVAAVLRYVPPWEDLSVAAKRTGLTGATLSAEGAWNASTGRVCMAGCIGAGDEACHYRVTLSVRTALSVTRRGSIVGRITAVDGSHPPLLFQQRVNLRLGSSGETPRMSYTYTKVEQARELLRASEPTGGFRGNFVAKSLLSYPDVAGAADDMASLSNLAGNLNLRFQCVVKPPFVPEWIEVPCFELQILSIGTLVVVGSYSPQLQGRPRMWNELLGRVHGVEKQPILNVSAEFTASGNFYTSTPVMSLEGVYNPEDGRMYLIGCRKVHAPWRVLSKSKDLEDGMDCSVEVTVEYPPTTTRWLMIGQTAKVSIASTREEDDPLRFARTELRTLPVMYRDQQWDELMKPIVEGLLCITLLSAAKIILVPVNREF